MPWRSGPHERPTLFAHPGTVTDTMIHTVTDPTPALPPDLDNLPETELAAIAAGQRQPAQVLHWQARATRITCPHAGGHTVVHHWPPAAPQPGEHHPPLVLLHGGSGSWTHWVRSIGALTAAGHAIWAVDMPGFGASDAVPGVTDVDGLPPVLDDMLHHLFGTQAVQLVGFSLGGMAAGLLAARLADTGHAHRIQQLVLVGPPGMGLTAHPPFRLQGWRHLSDPRAQLARHVFNLGELMLADPRHIDRDTVTLHVANVRRDRLPRRRLSHTDALAQALGRVQCPVTALYGEHDVLYPGMLDIVREHMAARVRDFRGLHTIAHAGHWVQYEAADALHARLLPVLQA